MTTTIEVRWDEQDGAPAGWYAQQVEDGEVVTDSQKISWPVDLDGYERSDAAEVAAALREAFPGASIEIR